jgi:F-type H+-transporting ATPase subunit gamma
MANLKQLRKRINSISSTRKITKAMQLISANKLSKAQDVLDENLSVVSFMDDVTSQAANILSRLHFKKNDNAKTLILITSDKGLCGGYNSSIARSFRHDIANLQEAGIEPEVILIGKKGRDATGYKDSEFYNNIPADYLEIVDVIAEKIINVLQTVGGSVVVYYNSFKNSITYEANARCIWPIEEDEDHKGDERDLAQSKYELGAIDANSAIKLYFKVTLLNALLSASASESSARMVAMDNATRNAKTLIDKLTLNLNRSRQAVVTKELIEIISGAEAL